MAFDHPLPLSRFSQALPNIMSEQKIEGRAIEFLRMLDVVKVATSFENEQL
jgi:hypothetical protein